MGRVSMMKSGVKFRNEYDARLFFLKFFPKTLSETKNIDAYMLYVCKNFF